MTPETLATIHDLEFVARVTVDGALSGLHRSPFHGYSAEFSQYRHYLPGDDLKYVDWKLFARSDRVYTKQFRETTNVRAQLVLDASASMGHRGANGVSKLAYGRMLGAALAHLLTQQGDASGLTVYDDRVRTYVGSRPGRSHLRGILAALSRVEPGGLTAPAPAMRRAVDLLRGRGVVILLSDLYDDEATMERELRRAARIGHDISVFHVLTAEEHEWRWPGAFEAEDSETGARILVSDADAVAYRSRMSAFVQRWRDRSVAANISYVLARTDAPPAQVLREFLLRRSGGPRP